MLVADGGFGLINEFTRLTKTNDSFVRSKTRQKGPSRHTFELDELLGTESLVVDRVGSFFVQILENEPFLKHVSGHGRDDRLLRNLTAY